MSYHPNRNTERITTCYTKSIEVLIHPHARKHGLTDEQILAAYDSGKSGALMRKDESEPPRWATIGFDKQARPVELLFVRCDSARVLVIHADYATKAFQKELRRGRRNGR